ncbi:SDR family NAD(P)-dependent oxidoreductase [Mycoplasmatota bacterium]|nr:SDR family NAD(P)-dependent oxidoreductase [Mycoplasmatota bacterium]
MNKIKKIKRYLHSYTNIHGKTYIVTGANSGLGFSLTKHLLYLGAHVIMACRNLNKANQAKNKLLIDYPHASLSILKYDQADFESINHFVEKIQSDHIYFDGLILNAGIFHPKKKMKTRNGFPMTIGTNYVGIFYLLKKLKDTGILDMNKDRRIIFVGSLACNKVKVKQIRDILRGKTSYAIKEYAWSKTLLGSLSFELSRHDKDSILYVQNHIKVFMMHPGVTSTHIVSSSESSYPNWFSKLAQRVLNVFVHSPDFASLGMIKLLYDQNMKEHHMLVPRGLFHISGYPKEVLYPKSFTRMHLSLIKISHEVIMENLKND